MAVEFEDFKFGMYRHYKGGLYSVVGLVDHHETRRPMVLYVSIEHGSFNVRPLHGWTGVDPDGFLDYVTLPDGRTIQRFEKL